jgi:hypothetical protein
MAQSKIRRILCWQEIKGSMEAWAAEASGNLHKPARSRGSEPQRGQERNQTRRKHLQWVVHARLLQRFGAGTSPPTEHQTAAKANPSAVELSFIVILPFPGLLSLWSNPQCEKLGGCAQKRPFEEALGKVAKIWREQFARWLGGGLGETRQDGLKP